jgi:hypothetical protein
VISVKKALFFLVLGSVLSPIAIILMMAEMGAWVGEYAVLFAAILSVYFLPVTFLAWALDEALADTFSFTIAPRAILIATVGALWACGLAFFIKPFAGDLLCFAAGGAASMGVCSLLANNFGRSRSA